MPEPVCPALRPLPEIVADLEGVLAYFERLVGRDGDCGESCTFIAVNDVRVIVRALRTRPSRRRAA